MPPQLKGRMENNIVACRFFGNCGGCSLQHISYAEQLKNKRNFLAPAIKFEDIKVFFGKPLHYRNRMDFIFHSTGLGFRKKHSFQNITDIDNCPIANEELNVLLREIRDFFKHPDFFDLSKKTGTFRCAVIRTPKKDSSISFVLNESSKKLGEAIEQIKKFAAHTSANNIIVTYVNPAVDESFSSEFFVVKGSDLLKENYLGREFVYSVQGFFQNNSEMAEKMQAYCNNILQTYNTKDASLLDLYGGVGTFGIINASLFKTVTIIENDKHCIDAANKNIELNKIKNANAIVLDAKNLKKIQFDKNLFVILDPPRIGMDQKTIEHLNKIKPEVILYISCNIIQLGKDIQKFKGHSIKSAALFDLFPQTNHSEAVVELVKKK